MTRLKDVAALGLLLIPLACGPAQPAQETDGSADGAAPPIAAGSGVVAATPAPTPALPPAGTGDGKPDLTPPGLTPEAERGETGARNILLSFARAIELAEYRQARALLSPADRQRWSEPAFAAIFADLADVIVAVPTGTLDAPAGESRYTAPITVTGRDPDGRPVRMEGIAVLRQAAAPGAAVADPPRWRFDSLTLDWTH